MQLQGRAETTGAPLPPKHTLIAELGRGGMATAYLAAVHGPGGFNKLVVIKRLRPALAEEPEFLRMFLDEARLAARIEHPNIVHTSEVGFDGAHYFIAMEFLDGQALENLVRRSKVRAVAAAGQEETPDALEAAPGVPLKLHIHILMKTLEGLDFAHTLKDFDGSPLQVVHRDVSPHNVMVTYDGHVKVVDFGIAKAADSSQETRTGVLKGKCAYMSPEQFGGAKVDGRADVFAVGTMLWQAITNRRLWRGFSDSDIFRRISTDQIPSPRTVVPDLDPRLEEICMKALKTSADERYASAAEFQAALEQYVAERPELRATSRELGAYVSEVFKVERAKIRSLIESRMAATKAARSVSGEDIMNLAEYFGQRAGSQSHTRQSPGAEPPARGWSRGRMAIVFGGCAVAVAAAVAVGMTRRKAPAAAAPPDVALVVVDVQPVTAKVTLDDVVLTGSPPQRTILLDNAQHRVHAEAPGYAPKTESLLVKSTSVTMDLSLDRLPAPPVVAATPTVTAAAPVQPSPIARSPAGRRPPPVVVPVVTTPSSPPSAVAPPVAPPPSAWPTGPKLDKTDPWGGDTGGGKR